MAKSVTTPPVKDDEAGSNLGMQDPSAFETAFAQAAAGQTAGATEVKAAEPSMADIMAELQWLHTELQSSRDENATLKQQLANPAAVRMPPIGMPKFLRIVLEDSDNIPPNGLWVCANGKGWLIKSGYAVRVPESITDVLDHAIEYAPVVNPLTRQVSGHRSRKRFPYKVLRDGEIAA